MRQLVSKHPSFAPAIGEEEVIPAISARDHQRTRTCKDNRRAQVEFPTPINISKHTHIHMHVFSSSFSVDPRGGLYLAGPIAPKRRALMSGRPRSASDGP